MSLAAVRQIEAIAPAEIIVPLPRPVPAVLAVGAFLKNKLCLAEGNAALISADCGDLSTATAQLRAEQTFAAFLDMVEATQPTIAHDRHPDFPSTRFAETMAKELGVEAVAVQHHHAHVAAVMAEHGLDEPVLGLALDGYGFGGDDETGGGAWGGELLRVDAAGFRRIGHLKQLRQPGGDAAARQPWRMGAAALHALGRGHEVPARFAAFPGADVIAQMLERDCNAPPTSSCGRLFDAACGLLGVKPVAACEGEAPMALERLASRLEVDPEAWRLDEDTGVLDMTPLLARLIDMEPARGAGLFHGTLVAAMAEWAAGAASAMGIHRVVLAGGCFCNGVLKRGLTQALAERGLQPVSPVVMGPGDATISLGQAWVVAVAEQHGNEE